VSAAHLEGAASWICGLQLGDIPSDVLDLARAQRIDVFAAAAAGRTTRAGGAIARAVDVGVPVVTWFPSFRHRDQ